MLVLDANAFLAIASRGDGPKALGRDTFVAPPLLWPETRSVLHVALWRGLIPPQAAERGLALLESGAVRERRHRDLGREAWRIADEFGWAKTYDAEYLALASLLGAGLVTFDRRMRRAAERLGVASDLPR